ncbi:UNVERIFIED_ORG: hypothetical protein B2H93_14720 [Clostridium botulinum]
MNKNELLKNEVILLIQNWADEGELMIDTFGVMVNKSIAILDSSIDKLIDYISKKVIKSISFLDKDRENDLKIEFIEGKEIIIGYL